MTRLRTSGRSRAARPGFRERRAWMTRACGVRCPGRHTRRTFRDAGMPRTALTWKNVNPLERRTGRGGRMGDGGRCVGERCRGRHGG
ncbi:hypothetical protein SBD_1769 [Streptomyces bottropensis ATCC 25435]|uniref:Uncharacterized protein n=1 Tax=Streptomyces bottropensis ATCC 25435 TaxID=1054862 RepID=M3DJD1_9ACTN|nr:hypothetical protein SBD_1769 [Streptomyces bottropensis ATCC 25435]